MYILFILYIWPFKLFKTLFWKLFLFDGYWKFKNLLFMYYIAYIIGLPESPSRVHHTNSSMIPTHDSSGIVISTTGTRGEKGWRCRCSDASGCRRYTLIFRAACSSWLLYLQHFDRFTLQSSSGVRRHITWRNWNV